MNDAIEFKDFHSDIIGKPPGYITRIGISFIAFFIVLVLIFSWLIDYSDAINARVQINSLNPTITVNSNQSGIIQSTFVQNGNYVKRGEDIILLNSEADFKNISNLKMILSNDLLNYQFQQNVSQKAMGPLRNDYLKLVENINQYQQIQNNPLVQLQVDKLKLENDSLTQKLGDIKRQQYLYAHKNSIAETEYKRTLKLKKNNLLSSKDLDSSQSKYIDNQISLEKIQVNINDIHSRITLNNNNIKILIAENKDALSTLALKINSQQLLLLDLIHSWEKKHLYKASISGIVSIPNNIYNHQNIDSNQELFSIIPQSTHLIGKIKIPENGVGKIKIGQSVSIQLDSYPSHEFGEITGKVLNKSSSVHESSVYIDVSINTNINNDNKIKTSYGKMINYIPNMQGQVEIITQKKNILSRIFENLII